MQWTRICEAGEIARGEAAAFEVAGASYLLVHGDGGWMAFAPVCPHAARFLVRGDAGECLQAGAPQCNRHLDEARGEASPGICHAPIFTHAVRQSEDGIYVDVGSRTLSALQCITCSPIVANGRLASLHFSLWTDGERKESVVARPARRAVV